MLPKSYITEVRNALTKYDPLNLINSGGLTNQYNDVETKVLYALNPYTNKSLLNQKITAIFKEVYPDMNIDDEKLTLLVNKLLEIGNTLGGIVHLLKAYYHQDVWEDHKSNTHEEVWLDFVKGYQNTLEPLIHDVDEMSTWTDKEIHNFIYEEENGGLRLDTPEEARAWLEKLRNFLEEPGLTHSS